MRITTLLNKLIGLQGLWVQGLEYEEDKGRVLVEVVPRRRRPRCGHCGRKVGRTTTARAGCGDTWICSE